MKIRTIPVRLTKREYQRFLDEYPAAKSLLAQPVVEDDGTSSELVVIEGDTVSIYIDEVPDNRKERLGKAASRRVLESYRRKPRWWLFLLLLCLFSGGFWVVKEQVIPLLIAPVKPTPTPVPSPTVQVKPTVAPTQVPVIVPTATPKPSVLPTVTPNPTAIPTTTPKPTASPTMTPQPTMNPTLTPTATSTPKPPEVKIQNVMLKDQNSAIIPLVNDTYSVKPQETVTLTTEVEGASSARSVKVTYYTVLGKIGADGVYTAPNKPGSIDLLTIKVVERNTGSVLAQRTLKMKIITTR
jgi:hypothetical protein